MGKSIEDVNAEAEIRDVQIRYCRGADRMDFDLMRSCFHPDATTDFGFFGGSVSEFIAAGRESLKSFLCTTHNTGNQLVEVEGETAWAEHYAVATHRLPADNTTPLRDFVTAVRYIDRMERRDGEWRIAHRRLLLDWCRTDVVNEGGITPDVPLGRRDSADPSYLKAQQFLRKDK
jgi:hypothetical protein